MTVKKIWILSASLILLGSIVPAVKAEQHSFGVNVSGPDGTVYTITTENGQTVRRPYTSAGAFLSYSFNSWGSVVSASPEDLVLSIGSKLPPQEGKVFCSDRGTDKGTCYLITSGQKAGFTSADVFHGLGYSFNNVLYGDVSFLNVAANISTSAAAHQQGTLVNKDGTIYMVSKDGLVGVPDPSTLKSWGYNFSDVVPANSADDNLAPTGVLSTRNPEQLEIPSAASNTSASSTPPLTTAPVATTTPASGSSTPAVSGGLGGGGGSVSSSGGGGMTGNIPFVFSQKDFNFNVDQGDLMSHSQQLVITNTSPSVYSFNIIVDNQPAWLASIFSQDTFNANPNQPIGLIIGIRITNLTPGNYSTNIKLVGNFPGSPAIFPVNLTLNPPSANPIPTSLSINSFTLPHAVVGREYGSSAITFNQYGNSIISVGFTGLPEGIGMPILGSTTPVISSSLMSTAQAVETIVLTGTPTQAGSFNVTLTLDNRDGLVKTVNFPFVVDAAGSQSSASDIRVGQLVGLPSGLGVYVGNGGLYTFSGADAFNSWGLNISQLVPANIAEQALPQVGIIYPKKPGCNGILDQIAGTCGN